MTPTQKAYDYFDHAKRIKMPHQAKSKRPSIERLADFKRAAREMRRQQKAHQAKKIKAVQVQNAVVAGANHQIVAHGHQKEQASADGIGLGSVLRKAAREIVNVKVNYKSVLPLLLLFSLNKLGVGADGTTLCYFLLSAASEGLNHLFLNVDSNVKCPTPDMIIAANLTATESFDIAGSQLIESRETSSCAEGGNSVSVFLRQGEAPYNETMQRIDSLITVMADRDPCHVNNMLYVLLYGMGGLAAIGVMSYVVLRLLDCCSRPAAPAVARQNNGAGEAKEAKEAKEMKEEKKEEKLEELTFDRRLEQLEERFQKLNPADKEKIRKEWEEMQKGLEKCPVSHEPMQDPVICITILDSESECREGRRDKNTVTGFFREYEYKTVEYLVANGGGVGEGGRPRDPLSRLPLEIPRINGMLVINAATRAKNESVLNALNKLLDSVDSVESKNDCSSATMTSSQSVAAVAATSMAALFTCPSGFFSEGESCSAASSLAGAEEEGSQNSLIKPLLQPPV